MVVGDKECLRTSKKEKSANGRLLLVAIAINASTLYYYVFPGRG